MKAKHKTMWIDDKGVYHSITKEIIKGKCTWCDGPTGDNVFCKSCVRERKLLGFK